jgi:phage RecT family recombinase
VSFRDTAAVATVRKLLEHKRAMEIISPCVPERLSYGAFMHAVLDVVHEKPEIADCRKDSIVRAVARAAAWDLKLGKQAYLIPREVSGSGKPLLMAMQSYIGKITLMIRFRMVTFVRAEPVYSGEPFEYEQGLTPVLKHLPNVDDDAKKGSLRCAYAWTIDPRSRVPQIVVMSMKEVDRIRQEFSQEWRSVTLESIPWYPVARAVHRLAKMIPTTTLASRVIDDDADDDAWRAAA